MNTRSGQQRLLPRLAGPSGAFGIACLIATVGQQVAFVVLAAVYPEVGESNDIPSMLAAFATFGLMSGVGALILRKLPRQRIGIIFAVAPVLLMAGNLTTVYSSICPGQGTCSVSSTWRLSLA